MLSMSRYLAPCAASLLAAALVTPAAAQPTVSEVTVRAHPPAHVQVRTKVVNYRDLKLNTPDGEEALLGRIRDAAEEVCAPTPITIKDLKEFQAYEKCVKEAIDGAVAQVKNPGLSAVYGRAH